MKEQKINIIMFNMSSYSDWSKGIQNRNYHILHTLHKDPRVRKILAVDFLPFNFKQSVKRYVNDIIKNSHGGEIVYGDFTSECHQISSKIYVYSTIDSFINFKIVNKEIKKIQKILNLHNIVSWSYNPLFTQHYYQINERLNVFDTVDNWAEHSDLVKYRNKLDNNYDFISKNADIIFTVSQNLVDFYFMKHRNENVYYINNGIDTNYFTVDKIQNPKKLEKFDKPEFKDKKIIGYIGTMQDDRIDIDLLQSIAKQHQDKIIVLGGPVWPNVQKQFDAKLKDFKNIIFTGRISRNKWIDFCSYFDVAINPHAVNEFNKYTNPTKIYEYLACGLPVISTNVGGVEYFGDDIYVANNKNEFNSYINQALNENTQEIKHNRINKAQNEYSWDARVEIMMDKIFSHPKMID